MYGKSKMIVDLAEVMPLQMLEFKSVLKMHIVK